MDQRCGNKIPDDSIFPIFSGRLLYDKKKGTFVWGSNVRPVLRVRDGRWNKVIVNVSDKFDSVPVNLRSLAPVLTAVLEIWYEFKVC